jgi:hypothetical protein
MGLAKSSVDFSPAKPAYRYTSQVMLPKISLLPSSEADGPSGIELSEDEGAWVWK